MTFDYKGLRFEVEDGRIMLTDCMGFAKLEDRKDLKLFNFVELQLGGRNHAVHGGAKLFRSSEWDKLKYIAYSETNDAMEIVQADKRVSVSLTAESFEDTKTLRICSEVRNVTEEELIIEHLSALTFYGLGKNGAASTDNLYLYRFFNSHHVECQPEKYSFRQLGLYNGNGIRSMKRIIGSNTGSWSSKEELPQAIIYDADRKKYLMFQIESNNGWHWEIGEDAGLLYLNIGGANMTNNYWSKKLSPKESFKTVNIAISVGDSINEVVADMTRYRRHIAERNKADLNLPVIFNEYMHLSWDNPNEKRTREIAPAVAELGAEYYVIDCGWHDECESGMLYMQVGKWQPSSVRFPSGIPNTVSYIKKLGMKAGLWLEPEIIGVDCKEMEEYYGDDCFMYRNGKKVIQSNRKFLDFRKSKVREYMSSVVERMVGYGVDYIKMDYNQDVGVGNEADSDSPSEGLRAHGVAFLNWVKEQTAKYPNLIVEGCASGGLRLDYQTLSVFSIVSTSDQTNYLNYPYIAGNILTAVLPEQAGFWSYPVAADCNDIYGGVQAAAVNDKISEDCVIINMVNAILGRIHLASAVNILDAGKKELVRQGIDYYKKIIADKKRSVPYLPWGFTNFGAKKVVTGLKTPKKIYLAVWKLSDDGDFDVPVPEYKIASAKVAYPAEKPLEIKTEKHNLKFHIDGGKTARIIEIEIY